MIVSDLAPGARGEGEIEGALWVSVGEPLANVGITAAERTLSPDEGRGVVSLTFGNYSDSTSRRHLRMTAGGKEVGSRDIDVPPGVSSFTLPLPPGLPAVRIDLSADALSRDNEVTLVEPPPRIVGVENRLRDGRGRQALIKALGAVAGVTQAESGHLAFIEAAAIDTARPRCVESGVRTASGGMARIGRTPGFHRTVRARETASAAAGMTLGGVVWPGVMPLPPVPCARWRRREIRCSSACRP